MQHSYPTLAFRSLLTLPLTSYLLPTHPYHRLMLLAVSSTAPTSSFPLDYLKVLQWNAEGLRARSTKLLHFLLSHLVDPICIQESNLNLSSCFQIPGFSLCNLIAPTLGLIFFLLMPHTLVAASSFSSGRAYPSLNFLPPLTLCLTPALIM